ncbi:MAG: VanW family protein [Candidatus Portnoybacteria bacterium]|nr:VanW family protein [Candidatus Portnoybacteria bacterium]
MEILNFDKIILGLRVGGVKIGGLAPTEAETLLNEKVAEWENQNIILIYQENQRPIKPNNIGVSLDIKTTMASAYDRGRNKNILTGLYEQILAVLPLRQNNIAPNFVIDEEKFKKAAHNEFSGLENPAENASLKYDSKTRDWQIIASRPGEAFNREKIRQDIKKRSTILNSSDIELTLTNDYPEISEDKTQKARNVANRILDNVPYFLIYRGATQNDLNQRSWTIDRETLIDWIVFPPTDEEFYREEKTDYSRPGNKILGVSLDKDKIRQFLIEIAPTVNREPINAQLAMENGKVTVFALSQDGMQLETELTAEAISNTIVSLNKTSARYPSSKKNIGLLTSKHSPQITTGNIDTLGLTSLLGRGVSNFSGSPENRVHNINVGTTKLNGILLKSGAEFSFNDILGKIGPQEGYLPELVIQKNKTVPEYGGGLCQVSTTAFRAAINSGLKIAERYPHAFPVKYYNPQGFDATVYPPHPDLRFINDTPNNLLIQSRVIGNEVIFEFYGTADGREVKVVGPKILSSKPDGSMKTVLYQEIWRDGQLKRKDTFNSTYKSPDLYPVIRNPLD